MRVKVQGFSFDCMNSKASIALCTLVSSRRQHLRLQNTVCVLVWRFSWILLVACFRPLLHMAGNTLNTQHALQYLICIKTLESRCAMTEKHGDSVSRRPCAWKRFFEIHEYRNYQKTIGFLASLFMLSKF